MRTVTFPYVGKEYTEIFKQTFENLGLNIQLPPVTTDTTIKLGVKNSSEMMCYPFKISLGNLIEALDDGADTILMFDSQGPCRFRHYAILQEMALRDLGYNFEMYGLNIKNALGILKKLTNKSSCKIISELYRGYKKIKEFDESRDIWSNDKPNIGILGEIYTCVDEKVNYGIENKIKEFGGNPFNTVSISDFISNYFKKKVGLQNLKEYRKEASQYLNGKIGGHAFENIYHLLWLIDRGVEGIVHLLPLSCMPETTIEPIMNKICKESKIPLLRVPVDENNSEANLVTRVETFVELIRMKR